MITIGQLASALYGTWLILKFDPRGLTYFEKTAGGFARSFIVAAILARIGLQIGVATAFGIVMLDFLMSQLMAQLIARI